MAYDAATSQLLLFGGLERPGAGFLADTWTFPWSQLSPATSPPAREAASMAYDAATNQLLLFGGLNGTGSLADTWTWGSPPAITSANATTCTVGIYCSFTVTTTGAPFPAVSVPLNFPATAGLTF
jgi:hypothetical protein